MVTYVPRSHYLGIHLYDERDRLSCINKFNYLGQPSHEFELSLRMYVKDKGKRERAARACKKYFKKNWKEYTDVVGGEEEPHFTVGSGGM